MKNKKTGNLLINLLLILFLLVFSANNLFAAAKEKAAGASKSKTVAADVKAGDCAACHKDKKVLPDNHVATREMPYEGCVVCHAPGQGAGSLKGKIYGSHLHALRGIKCAMCHGQVKTPEAVEMDQCVTCHGATAKLAEKTKDIKPYNPHSSPHYGTDLDCNLCHHQHAKSENYCAQCHNIKNVTSSTSNPPGILTKSSTEKVPEGRGPSGIKEEKPVQAVVSASTNKNSSAKSAGPSITCKTCHIEPKYQKYFEQTRHGSLSCEICHKGITDFTKHMKGGETVQTISCNTCHQDIRKKGFHVTLTKFSCLQCHSADIHPGEAVITKKGKTATTVSAAAPKITDCTSCHSGSQYTQHFARTSHAPMGCAVCHQGIRDIPSHLKKKPVLISCGVCHRDIEKKYLGSAHDVVAKLSCIQCHTDDIHPGRQVTGKKDKTFPILACTRCHSDQDKYVKNGHTAKFLAGNKDAATCNICHGIHETPLFPATEKGISDKRSYYTGLCVSCHKKGGVAGRYGIFPMAVSAYGETFHGKAMKLGYPDQVAGCADCHIAHNILPPDNPASPINPKQLVKTCGKCHKGFHPRFVSYSPHPVPDEASRFRGLYLTKVFMIALLTGVFGFFGIHTLLWWRRAFIERSELIRSGLRVRAELPEEEGRQYIRRFTVSYRIMHVVLVCSFLGIVVSGFPIKYPDAWASKVFITLFGGVENAGHIHRFCGVIMWALFLYTCWLSIKFLFPGFRFKGWVGRLFGPDSLFPRIKDLQDCWGMFKWFFNRGKKPQFDRWTYWEKFDFMAVFWGMFIIGLSGIVMWIPELTSYVMPGWMINIMQLAHSEEALLAAVFIFMFHFFHNHTVPDKFPLEKNIFTGSYTLESLKRERPVEYERILKENRLDKIKCKGPGIGIQLFADIFGIVSILIGLLFAILIFVAVFST